MFDDVVVVLPKVVVFFRCVENVRVDFEVRSVSYMFVSHMLLL